PLVFTGLNNYSNVSHRTFHLNVSTSREHNSAPLSVPRVSLHQKPGQKVNRDSRPHLRRREFPMRSHSLHFLFAFLTVVIITTLTFGQSATTSLRGTITDARTAVLTGASVTISNAATGFSRTVKSDDQGVYQFLEVPPASYVVTVNASGFAVTKHENVLLQVSNPATLNFSLQVQGGSEIVDVT